MASAYDISFSVEAKTKNGKLKRDAMRVTRKDGQKIEFDEAKAFYDFLLEDTDPENISVCGMGIDRYFTMKGYGAADLNDLTEEQYYQDHVNDPSKFMSYFFVDFSFRRPNLQVGKVK
jgi:hypothetical protein